MRTMTGEGAPIQRGGVLFETIFRSPEAWLPWMAVDRHLQISNGTVQTLNFRVVFSV